MKKFVALVLLVVIVFGLIPEGFARQEPQMVTVSIDGRRVSVSRIEVLVDNKPVITDVPPILYENRTMVPIRFAENYLNAKIFWNQQTKQATIRTSDKVVTLELNSPDIIVNGNKEKIPYGVPAKLVDNSRIMVPLRFVSDVLGYDVDWNQNTRTANITTKREITVTNIRVEGAEKQFPKVSIEGNGEIQYRTEVIDKQAPYRLVVDILNSKLNITDRKLWDSGGRVNFEVNKHPIKEIRASQFSVDPNITRVVIVLEELGPYEIVHSQDKKSLNINFVNYVKDIRLESIEGQEAIIIENSYSSKYNILRFTNPSRVAIDIMDTVFQNNQTKYNLETSYIKGIRTFVHNDKNLYPLQDNVVRLTLDLADNINNNDIIIMEQGKNIIVRHSNRDMEQIKYVNNKTNGSFLEIDLLGLSPYNVSYNANDKVMSIRVPRNMLNVMAGTLLIKDEIIDIIQITEDSQNKHVNIFFKEDVNYEIKSNNIDNKINISFERKKRESGRKLIVIDPGHGGRDPGTIGINTKVTEKELCLKIALKLRDRLEELGFDTILTRDKDVFVSLEDRAKLANDNNADAFISIHFNASTNKSARGIETYYCPAFSSPIKTGDNYPFAKAIHDEIIKATKLSNRGIKKETFSVLRNTKMVAVLLELGFMSNPDEEKIVVTDAYHDKVVEAIATGLVKYFQDLESKK